MKAKKYRIQKTRCSRVPEESVPHELGTHLFAMIRRNLISRNRPVAPVAPVQLQFAL